MRYLLIPENNSLSHIAKCLSIMDILKLNGHETHIAISTKHSPFLNNLGVKYHLLSDIQETDGGGFPSFKWFSNIDTIVNCIEEEAALINQIKPDRILGVFRFTLYASSKIAKIPYDSLICGCMIPEFDGVLGFSENETGKELQKYYLDNFFGYAGKKMSLALTKFGLDEINDIRYTLKGERTFLWDFPKFLPIQKQSDITHVGPIPLHHWSYDNVNLNKIIDSKYPLAVVSFGTCITDSAVVHRIVRILLELGYKVIVAAGGQTEMLDFGNADPRVTVLRFAPLNEIFPYTSLLVTHGGQMTVFEALQNQIPVLVMPLQPEQAHNGICLERISCGNRLIPSTYFIGVAEDYINAFNRVSDNEIKTKINNLVTSKKTKENLTGIKKALDRYRGAKTIAELLEVK